MDIIKNNIFNKYDKNFYNDLFKQIYQAIYNNDIHLLIKLINELLKDKNNKYIYLNYLLNPDVYKYIKIPNNILLPTSSFQLHRIIKTNTGEKGNICILFNPFFLYDNNLIGMNNYNYDNDVEINPLKQKMFFYNNDGKKCLYQEVIDNPDNNWNGFYAIRNLSTLLVNTDSTVDSSGIGDYYDNHNNLRFNNDSWIAFDINQKTSFFTSYRLVSAEIIIKYTGPELNASGIFHGSIINDDRRYLGGNIYYLENDDNDDPAPTPGTIPPIEIQKLFIDNNASNTINELSSYSIYNTYYYKQTKCNEGIKLIYYPIDNTYEEFVPLLNYSNLEYITQYPIYYYLLCKKNYRSGFNFFIIGNDLPININKDYLQIEIICNFEAFYKTEYLNHMPYNQTNITLSNEEKNDVINILKNNNIFKANENTFLNINNDIININK